MPLEHSDNFNVVFYTYTPEDRRLSSLYCRLITREKYRGLTLDEGLEPKGYGQRGFMDGQLFAYDARHHRMIPVER